MKDRNSSFSHRFQQLGLMTLVLGCFVAKGAFAAYPTVTQFAPRGLQAGTEVSLTIKGTQLADFRDLMFFTPGMTMTQIEKAEDREVVCKVSVDPDVEPGNHLVRVVTKSGLSHGRQIFVGRFPIVAEQEPNNDLELAQTVSIGQTLEGLIQVEDVDFFKIHLKKGQRIGLEVEGLRLGYGMFDPYIAIVDAERFEQMSSDDTILHKQDGYGTWVAEKDGDYYILVRESSYRGGNSAFYRLHVGDFRRPDVLYPAGAKAGTKTKVKFIERDGSTFEEEVTADGADGEDQFLFASSQKPAPSGNPFRVVSFDNAMEVEPNASRDKATRVKFDGGVALNGIIQEEKDVDYFVIPLKKGQKLQVQAFGQALGSPIDSVVNIYDPEGKSLKGNDDGGGSRRLDSKVDVDIPADGDYFVRVADHLERGGKNFVYRIEVQATPKSVHFSSPFFTNNDSHYRQFVPVPKGGRFAAMVNVTRRNVSGEFAFEPENLPPGVKLLTPSIPKDLTNIPLLFEAAPDAEHAHATVPVHLKPTDPKVEVQGGMKQLFEIVRRGVIVYHTEYRERMSVAVVDEAPYSLEIVTPKAPLVAGGALNLTVKATRKEGFDAPIRVLMVWKPPGISVLGERTIPKGQNECVFSLTANGNVKAGEWNFTVLGEADGGSGRVYNASPFCVVETAPPSLTAPAMAMAAVERGKEGALLAKLEQLIPFEGEATARVVGLPETIVVEPAKVKKDTKEVVFKVTTTEKSPLGKRGNLYVQVDVPTEKGEPAIHRVATGSSVRIDAPRKAPAAVAAKPKEEPKKAAPKPMSRLEQLRQEAAALAAGKN